MDLLRQSYGAQGGGGTSDRATPSTSDATTTSSSSSSGGDGDDGGEEGGRSEGNSLKRAGEEVESGPGGGAKRSRVFPHVEGNFATFVYVDVARVVASSSSSPLASLGAPRGPRGSHRPVDLGRVASQLSASIAQQTGVQAHPLDLGGGEGSEGAGVHISLSRPLVVRATQISVFTDLLRKQLRQRVESVGKGRSRRRGQGRAAKKTNAVQLPFWARLGGLRVLLNEDESTCFVVVEVGRGDAAASGSAGAEGGEEEDGGNDSGVGSNGGGGRQGLNELVAGVDAVLARFPSAVGRPYPAARLHHLSLLWCPNRGNALQRLRRALASPHLQRGHGLTGCFVDITNVQCKVGKRVVSIV